MAVIKRADAKSIEREAVVLDLGDIARQAEMLRARAREQAEAIVAEARAEREKLISDAQEKGFAAGLDAGYREGYAQGEEEGRETSTRAARVKLDEIERAWTEALDAFADQRHHLLVGIERHVEAARVVIRDGPPQRGQPPIAGVTVNFRAFGRSV